MGLSGRFGSHVISPLSVRGHQGERLLLHGEDRVRPVPDSDPHPAPQHVDRHDGQHLRHRYRNCGQTVPKAGDRESFRII